MDDFMKTVKAQLYERVTSPLVFAVVVSWALWNYRFVLIVLSSLSATDKFFAIEMLPSQYASSFAYWVQFGFLYPLLSASFYLFLLPIPSRRVYEYVRKEQKKLKEIQTRIDDETPLTQEEARLLRSDLRLADKRLSDLHLEYSGNVERLKQQVLDLEMKNSGLSQQLSDFEVVPLGRAPVELSELEASVLRKISEAEHVSKRSVFVAFRENNAKVIIQHALDGLLTKKMIKAEYVEGEDSYTTTVIGRDRVVKILTLPS
jgi:hypothetical protein